MDIANDLLIRKIEDGSITPSDLSSRRLNKSQVLIEVPGKNRYRVFTIKNVWSQYEIVDLILEYFALPHYITRIGKSRKAKLNKTCEIFFSFLEKNESKYVGNIENEFDELTSFIFSDWRDYLVKTASVFDVYKHLLNMTQMVTLSINKRYKKVTNCPVNLTRTIEILKDSVPPQPKYNKTPPLGRFLKIPASEFTNLELLLGLRFGVIWLLQRIQSFRNDFQNSDYYLRNLNFVKGKTKQEIMSLYRHLSLSITNTVREGRNIKSNTGYVKSAALDAFQLIQGDYLLSEWQFYSSSKKLRTVLDEDSKTHPFSSEMHREFLSRSIRDGALSYRLKGYGKDDSAWEPFKLFLGSVRDSQFGLCNICFWGIDWFAHSKLEQLLMVWLLATERAQKTGIKKLLEAGVQMSENKSSLQISTSKLRRGSNRSLSSIGRTDVESIIYKRNSPPYQIYSTWLAANKLARECIAGYNSGHHFIPRASYCDSQMIDGKVKRISSQFLPLQLLCVPGTSWNKMFLRDSGGKSSREGQAFIAMLKNRIRFKKNNLELGVNLPVNVIGQSLVLEKEIESNYSNNTYIIESNVMGHSGDTGRSYKDGYSTLGLDEIIEPVRDFARKVGDKKIELAHKIAERFNTTTDVVSFDELEEICDIKSVSRDQKRLLEKLDELDKITIAGEIKQGEMTLVVETEMTAALMWGYLKHLEESLPQLMLGERTDTIVKYMSRFIHLNAVYRRFSHNIQQSGRKLAATTSFPFPPLV